MSVAELSVRAIRAMTEAQPREVLNDDVVASYAEDMAGGAEFPPVVVFEEAAASGTAYWLADGFHRLEAAKRAHVDLILADIHPGALRDAILYSTGANAAHGFRRSNEDKRRAVRRVIDDSEWSQKPDREIARLCHVSHEFVRRLRDAHLSTLTDGNTQDDGSLAATRVVTRSGATYQMNTAAIGKADVGGKEGPAEAEARDFLDAWDSAHPEARKRFLAEIQGTIPAAAAQATEAPSKLTPREAERHATIARLTNVIPEVTALLKGTLLDTAEYRKKLAPFPPNDQLTMARRDVAFERREAKRVARDAREIGLAEKIAKASAELQSMPRYGVIHADPAWRFEPYGRDTGMDRAADNHYPTMPTAVIRALDVPAADDCVLFLWATAPMLPDAFDVMASWGFEYKSQIIWAKDRVGTGYWARNKHELLLIGTRGNIPAPAPGTQPESLINAPIAGHSVKPDVFTEIIEKMFPTLPKLEMFARRQRPGWDAWGAEAPISNDTEEPRQPAAASA